MVDNQRKLSPAEFLAELKGQPPSGSFTHAGPPVDVDSLGLDFSDLDDSTSAFGDFEVEADLNESIDDEPLQVEHDLPPKAVALPKGDVRLESLFDRVSQLLDHSPSMQEGFHPHVPSHSKKLN